MLINAIPFSTGRANGFGPGWSPSLSAGGATGITPAMAMLTAYSRTLTDEVASYEATYTGASHKTMTDQYGLQTFAPNNFIFYSNDFSNAAWLKFNSSVASGVSDPDGGSNAWTLTATTAGGFLRNIAAATNNNIINSIWIRRRTGTSNVSLASPDGSYNVIAVTSSWQQFYYKSLPASGTSTTFAVALTDLNDQVDIYQAQREYVTHETTPRAYNATTSAAYYGPRFVYAPETLETSTTSITIGSGSSYTFTTAAAHSFAVGDVVQATDNADPDNYVRGYVTNTTGNTVTLASYTFPGTAYSRPVLTNGSGTISDWSVIRSDGYLAEPAATNSTLHSNDLTQSSWLKSVTITADDHVSPDGTANADRVTGASTGRFYQAYTVTPGNTYTFSTYILNGTASAWNFEAYDAIAAAVISTSDVVSSINTSTFTRLTLTFTAPAGCTVARIYLGCTAGFVGVLVGEYFWHYGSQFELGSVATSYIPTTTASVARSADVASMTSTNFSGWWNATEGTFVSSAITRDTANAWGIFEAYEASGKSIFMDANGNRAIYVADAGVQADISPGGAIAGASNLFACAYKADDFGAAVNGTAGTPDTSGTVPTPTELRIGLGSQNVRLTAPLQHLLYFNTRESDAQLVTLTGG